MKNSVAWLIVLVWSLWLPVHAADVDGALTPGAKVQTSPLLEALKLREQLVAALVAGGEDTASVVAKLKAHPDPTGLGLSRETEYAFAVVDIGQRLVVAQRLKDAESFFREAEEVLGQALELLSEDRKRERVLVLRKRALVRSQFLGKGPEAKADLNEAIRLRPEDKTMIERQRDHLLSGYGELNRPETRN